ncbi:hypothetical protein OF385_07070 [Glutamicibacter sp. JL.03c]|uniref:hypothetical protein n=1 Tax=Glutamicibacter sp. JL.03c TaxID=2984842 RepID=UPI0021F6E2B2|nr:hypothetical protein [Glutamicibacter sp. JL.03c]UYQ78892.1 hypothetical protein OF385_07070 [Glutamicibacter sp. JL.03c]
MPRNSIDQKVLHRYLIEHLLGSESGLNHFKAAHTTWAKTPYAARFDSLHEQVQADQVDLKRIMERLGCTQRPLARLFAPLAKLAGHVNPFNPLRRRELAAAQVQLDVLTGLLNAKLRMWQTLLLMVPHDPRLDPSLLRELSRRAESQISQLKALSDETWAERFAPEVDDAGR